jgi:hypothetical protein
MAMPTNSLTQSISFAQLQNEFGGSDPVGMAEYYRGAGAGYVPWAVSRRIASWTQYGFVQDDTAIAQLTNSQYGPIEVWHFNSGIVHQGLGASYQNGSYQRGDWVGSIATAADTKNNIPAYTTYYYKIKRWQYNWTSVNVNQNVPSSATISMLQFYGGTDD